MKKRDIHLKKQTSTKNQATRLILAPFTLGLSFIGYNSEKQASLNQKTNKDNRRWNVSHKIEVDQENSLILKDITSFNENCNGIISFN